MAIEVKAHWHRLTNADDSSQSPVFVNEAEIAYVRPMPGRAAVFEIGLASGSKLAVHEDPEDFLGGVGEASRTPRADARRR